MDGITAFDILVWGGTLLTLIGLGLLILCIVKIFAARKSAASDEALQSALKRLVPLNLGAVALSAIGLMCVILGIVLT